MPDERVVRETERWFLRRGLPHFIADYNASQDIWTRALPALTFLFALEIAFNAPSSDFPVWLSALVVAGSFAALVIGWAVANRVRGRPGLARPNDIGPFEIAFFVLVPALVPLAAGGQFGSAVVTAAGNLVILGVIYVSTSYGIVPMTRWGFGRFVHQAGTVLNLLVRALPLLLLFITFLFINTEVWQVASGLTWQALVVVMVLFVLVGTSFAVIRLPRQIGELARFESWDRAEQSLEGTPLDPVLTTVEEPPAGTPSLSGRQWSNVGLVVLVSEAIQIALVAVLVFAFFIVFGTFAIERSVIEAWLGQDPSRLATWNLWGQELVLTRELVHVSAFLAAFSGLYFTVVLLTDAIYREEFLDDVLAEVRESFAARAVYLAYLDGGAEASATISPT